MSGTSCIMAHMVAFYPDGARSRDVARGLAEGGASYLEMQFPFSDPTADGPDIQRACSAALDAGFTVDAGFELTAAICGSLRVPVFLMSYANLLFSRGVTRFLADAAACGVRGVIVPDLPADYDEGLFQEAARAGLAAVPVLSPSMRDARLARICSLQAEFLYVTLRTGTTGALTELDGPGSRVSCAGRTCRGHREDPRRLRHFFPGAGQRLLSPRSRGGRGERPCPRGRGGR